MQKPIGLLAALTFLLAVVGVVVTPGVSGAAPPASGNVSCRVSGGTGTFSPPLTFAGTPGGDKFTFKATSRSCSGSVVSAAGLPVHVSGATLKAVGYWNPTNSCAGLPTDLLGVVTWKITYVSTPAIAATTVTTSGGTPWVVSGTHFEFTFPAGGSISSSAGSFAPVPALTVVLKTSILSACSTGWGPYPTATVRAGHFAV